MVTLTTPGGTERRRKTAEFIRGIPAFTPGGAARQAATGAVIRPMAELVGDVLFGPSAPTVGGGLGAKPPTTGAATNNTPRTTNSVADYLNGPGAEANNTPRMQTDPAAVAQMEPGAATPNITTTRDANGNLVFTGTGPAPAQRPMGAAPRPRPPAGWQNNAEPGSLASFFGAAMNQKRLASTEAIAQAAAEKEAARMAQLRGIGMETTSREKIAGQKVAVNPKDIAESAILQERLQAARGARTPEERHALLTGSALPQDSVIYPAELQPMPGTPGYGATAVGASRSGRVFQTPIQAAPAQLVEGQTGTAKDSAGNTVPVVVRNGVLVRL